MDLQCSTSYQSGKNKVGFEPDEFNCYNAGFLLLKIDVAMPNMPLNLGLLFNLQWCLEH